jgi:hypothetical protein
MARALNDLTRDEIEKHLEEKVAVRACDFCGKRTEMRNNQRFCNSVCRSAFSNLSHKQYVDSLKQRIAELEEQLMMLRGDK